MIEKICQRCKQVFMAKWSFQKYCGSKKDISTCSGKVQREQQLMAGRKWRKAHPEYNIEWRKRRSKEQIETERASARLFYHKNKIRQNKLNRERAWRIKASCIELLGGQCSICGYDKNIASLDFHHINNEEKEYDGEWKLKSFKDKIKRGIIRLLCANCHREIHHLGRTIPASEVRNETGKGRICPALTI